MVLHAAVITGYFNFEQKHHEYWLTRGGNVTSQQFIIQIECYSKISSILTNLTDHILVLTGISDALLGFAHESTLLVLIY